MECKMNAYLKEIAEIINVMSTYKALKTKQIYLLFSKPEHIIRQLLKQLIKQKRLFYDEVSDFIKYYEDCKPDGKVVHCFWILLDFIEKVEFHTLADYPAVICFFAKGQIYEIVYVPYKQESVINCAFRQLNEKAEIRRIVVVEESRQIPSIDIPDTAGFCKVDAEGRIEYYQLQ